MWAAALFYLPWVATLADPLLGFGVTTIFVAYHYRYKGDFMEMLDHLGVRGSLAGTTSGTEGASGFARGENFGLWQTLEKKGSP